MFSEANLKLVITPFTFLVDITTYLFESCMATNLLRIWLPPLQRVKHIPTVIRLTLCPLPVRLSSDGALMRKQPRLTGTFTRNSRGARSSLMPLVLAFSLRLNRVLAARGGVSV